MSSEEKINDNFNRRDFLRSTAAFGTILSGIPLLYWSPLFQSGVKSQSFLGSKEFGVVQGLVSAWSDNWPMLPKDGQQDRKQYFENLNQVMAVIREDKRNELRLALKLLSYPPACFFLTGFFRPWSNKESCLEILNNWQVSQNNTHKKLYMAFVSLFSAPLYSDPASWSFVGYPGPPEVDSGSRL